MFLFLATMVSAGTENVMFEIKLEYDPQSQTTCVSEFDNSTNQTWTNCTTINNGIIKVVGGEEETIIVITKTLDYIIEHPGVIYTGYKTADLGNLSDITGINDKLDYFADCNDKLNDCMDSNREVSSKLILLEEDSGLKSNFTTCSANLVLANTDLTIKKSEIKTKSEKIKSLESSKIMWILFGGIIGAILIGVVVPKMRGKDTPDQPSGRDFPPNPGY